MRWSYIGSLGPDGGLNWGGDPAGNIPNRDPSLPNIDDLRVYLAIQQYVREGRFDGQRVDWGAAAIKIDGPGLQEILGSIYGDLSTLSPERPEAKYAQYAKELGPGNYVAFISLEL